jgi:hypothetical protein
MMQIRGGLRITNRFTVSHERRRWFGKENGRFRLRISAHLYDVVGVVTTDAVNAVYWKTRVQPNDGNRHLWWRRNYIIH